MDVVGGELEGQRRRAAVRGAAAVLELACACVEAHAALGEEQVEAANPARVAVPRVHLHRTTLENLSDHQILKKFRLSRVAILALYQRISQDLEPLDGRNYSIPGLVKLLAVLYHFAKHSFQADSGEEVGISQPSFSRCLTQVVRALVARAKEYIHFPTDRDSWKKVKLDFYQVAGFPKVLGAIDCTHVALRRPTNNEELYRNRKHFHSLNVQVVCDADQRIMSVRPGNPGSFHDSRILQQSGLSTLFEDGEMPEGWLIGKSQLICCCSCVYSLICVSIIINVLYCVVPVLQVTRDMHVCLGS